MRSLLSGVRVVDFSWIGAGSYTTKILADLGADVIKIESSDRIDTLRVTKPFKDGKPGVNRSGYFADRNSSKRSMTLNVKDERGLAMARRLITDADVVTNNFTPGVMDKLGLGYDVVSAIAPRVVYASMSMQGAAGPLMKDLGYGLTIAALSGMQHMTGLPDRQPAGTGTNYPDHIPNPAHAAFAVLAALRHQRRTGVGQFIDLAQMEPTLAMMGPSMMNYLVNTAVDGRNGNQRPGHVPSGVFPCCGQDRWIAIEVCNDVQWAALVSELGIEAPADWNVLGGRADQRALIEKEIVERTSQRDASELAHALQAVGVPAGPVHDARDVMADSQLEHRNHWTRLMHPEMGLSTYNAPPYRFSDADARPSTPAPLLGEHTAEICRDLLGLNDEAIQELMAQGVLR